MKSPHDKALKGKKESAKAHIKRKALKPMYDLPKGHSGQEWHN